MIKINDLSEILLPVVNFEINRGNQIVRIDRPAGSNCPLAIIFIDPLDIPGYLNAHVLEEKLKTWENRDRHYPLEKGFVCKRTGQAIAGPLNTNSVDKFR